MPAALTSIRHPPLSCVLIIEFDLLHHLNVVPVCKDDQRETPLSHVLTQLLHLLWKILLLAVYQQ